MIYTQKQLSFKDLYQYHQIPMLKEYSSVITFDDEYTMIETPTPTKIIDMTKEESIDEWKTLLPEHSTNILVFTHQNKWIVGAIVATNAPKIKLLENNPHQAILWDIRIDPSFQGQGLAKKLFNQACMYAKQQGCHTMLIETQNNNPKAIKFYQHMGAKLYKVRPNAYKDQPDEIQYLFQKKLL